MRAAVVALVLGSAALAAGSPSPSRLARRASHAINAAIANVQRQDPSCRFKGVTATTYAARPPSDKLLSIFGALRRPADATDDLDVGRLRYLGPVGLYRDNVRRLRTDPHADYFLVPAQDPSGALRARVPAAHCHDAFIKALHRQTRRYTLGVRRAIDRRAMPLFNQWKAAAQRRPSEGLYVARRTASNDDLSLGGGTPLWRVRRYGQTSTTGTGAGRNAHASVAILVPDGVVRIAISYPAQRAHHRGETTYKTPYATIADVVNNLAIFDRVPRAAFDAFPHRVRWYGAEGQLLSVFTPRGSSD